MKSKVSKIEKAIYRLFEISPIAIVLSHPDGKLEYVNPASKALLGYEEESIYSDDVVITHPDDIPLNLKIRNDLKKEPFTPIQVEKRYLHKSGKTIYTQLNIVAQPGDDGGIKRYISQIIDITVIKKLESAEILINYLVKHSSDAIYVVEPKYGQILNCNNLAHKRLGCSKKEILNLTIADIDPRFKNSDKWNELIYKVKAEGDLIFESTHIRRDGTVIPIETNISYLTYNRTDYFISIVRDISRRKRKELEAIELANLDPLTKLPNRSILESRLNEVILKADKSKALVAFLFIDLDNFKQLNDTYGHAAGDEVLVDTANRLKNTVRQSDILTRLGGDEFLIVLGELESQKLIKPLAEKILLGFNSPFKIEKELIKVEASIGVSIYSENNASPRDLIQLADEAMYQAKRKAGTSIYYI